LGIFHLPKLKIITIGNLPVKPPQRNDLNQLASLIPGAIHTSLLSPLKKSNQSPFRMAGLWESRLTDQR
jgi:hypothetical protein